MTATLDLPTASPPPAGAAVAAEWLTIEQAETFSGMSDAWLAARTKEGHATGRRRFGPKVVRYHLPTLRAFLNGFGIPTH